MFDLVWLIPVFPAIGVVINGLFGRWIEDRNKSLIHWVACSAVGLSFVLSVLIFFQLRALPSSEQLITFTCFNWISAGEFQSFWAYQIDPLSMVMALFVTGVGFLIHVYSIGYMGHAEGRYYRYFTYLNLFMFSMINLILADNFLLMFLGWEGVGLCSYLLIGFWFGNIENAKAGKKAFITNRIGDFAFLIGLFLLVVNLGEHGIWSLSYTDVFSNAHLIPQSVVTAVCLLFFIGCTAKSAQIPLYVWLPDAMAGPTPVSALIHAATMVTSGIYFVTRSNILYSMSPFSLQVVAVIGALTALLAATIALTQNDIKRVLAYSTVSQLGYMFLALGVGAFSAGIFHVVTHSFFKALLFLGAGSVMHALSDEQDMRKMGGLRTKTPITYWTMLIGTLAIAGFPGFSGFFSKDEILWKSFAGGHFLLWGIGTLAACLTAAYMFRLIFMTFFNECRASDDVKKHIHESPASMTVPMMILAVLSLFGGALGVPAALGGSNRIEHFLSPVIGTGPDKIIHGAAAHGHEAAHAASHAGHHNLTVEYAVMALSVLIVFIGIGIAYWLYVKRRDLPQQLATRMAGVYNLLLNKWYVDELYDAIFIRPLHNLSQFLWKGFDVLVIDGLVNGMAHLVARCGGALRYVQTGYVQVYAISLLVGVAVLVLSSIIYLI